MYIVRIQPEHSMHNVRLYNTTSTKSSAIAVIADRTACSILRLLIVTATSRPLN